MKNRPRNLSHESKPASLRGDKDKPTPDDPKASPRDDLSNPETQRRLRANLDRFMQSANLRMARDIVSEDPLLLCAHVSDWLGEGAKRLRQDGDIHHAEALEFRLRLLRTFREFGVEEGYLELVIGDLALAQTAEDHERILRDNPDLTSEATNDFISRRIKESMAISDATAAGKYELVHSLIHTEQIHGTNTMPELEGVDLTEAVNTFVRRFIHEPDPRAQRQLLEARPDLLQSPLCIIVGGMFQPFVERARTANDLVTLQRLLLRQALFARCQKVGIADAFRELAEGVKWNELNQP